MKRMIWALMLAATALAVPVAQKAEAVSLRELTFDDLVKQAAVIFQGRVLETKSFVRGVGLVRGGAKAGELPASEPVTQDKPQAPQSAQTRGGRMIFTHIVLETADPIKGTPGQRVEFDIAGGTVDGRTAWIPGMPSFERGADYLLFLREKFEGAADPILGVRQGYFRVVDKTVLNADFDFVLGIEDGRVVPRYNAERGKFTGVERPIPQIAPLPIPSAGGPAATMSAAARRYLESKEPPMALDGFVKAIHSRLGR